MENTFDNETIVKIVTQYKRKREMEKLRYDTKLKNDPEYKKKCCERSRAHYQKNKEKIKAKTPCPHCSKIMSKNNITRHIKKYCKSVPK